MFRDKFVFTEAILKIIVYSKVRKNVYRITECRFKNVERLVEKYGEVKKCVEFE